MKPSLLAACLMLGAQTAGAAGSLETASASAELFKSVRAAFLEQPAVQPIPSALAGPMTPAQNRLYDQIVEGLVKILDEGAPVARYRAAVALGEMSPPPAAAASSLAARTQAELDPQTRLAAIRALGRIVGGNGSNPEGIAALNSAAAADSFPDCRSAAQAILAKIAAARRAVEPIARRP